MSKAFRYCLHNGILGVGWRVNGLPEIPTWEAYEQMAQAAHADGFQGPRYIRKCIAPNDLIWTRSPAGEYYLAKAKTGWKYWQGQEAIDEDIDIANVFECEFQRIEPASVPGKVVACFRPQRTIQRINDPSACQFSKLLWNTRSGTPSYQVAASGGPSDIFMMFDDKDTEDLVALYLQRKGWVFVPSSRMRDTMGYEYYLVNPSTGETCIVQVKTGFSAIDRNMYSGFTQAVFLFQPNDCYFGSASTNVREIPKEDLIAFFRTDRAWLPETLTLKAELIGFR